MTDFKNAGELLNLCNKKNLRISDVMKQRECDLGETTMEEIHSRMKKALEIMKQSAHEPLETAVKSMGGLIGGEAQKLGDHRKQKEHICGDVLSRGISYAMAVLEVSASMGVIVAAPTAGSAGIVPGLLLSLQQQYQLTDEQVLDALFNAGAIGYLARPRWGWPLQWPHLRPWS